MYARRRALWHRFLRRVPSFRALFLSRFVLRNESGGAPAHAVGWGTPRSARRSRVPARSVYRQGQDKRLRRPCLSLRVPSSPLLRLRSLGVAFGLPLGSKRRRGSLRLKTLASSPHAVPPVPAFSPLPLQRRGLSLAPFGRWRSGGRVPRPRLFFNSALRRVRGCALASAQKEQQRVSGFCQTPTPRPRLRGRAPGSVNRASLSVSNLTDSKFILDFFCNL